MRVLATLFLISLMALCRIFFISNHTTLVQADIIANKEGERPPPEITRKNIQDSEAINSEYYQTISYQQKLHELIFPTPTPTPKPIATPEAAITRAAETRTPTPPSINNIDRVSAIKHLLKNAPLAPYAELMVIESDAVGIDWRMIPVMSILESSGGVAACGFNAWGVSSCHGYNFSSWEEGIHTVAAMLVESPYAGHTLEDKLCIWVSGNPCYEYYGNYVNDFYYYTGFLK